MQQMGDDESKEEIDAMYAKIKKREQLSASIAQFFPPLQVQLSMNAIAQTSLSNHIDFLDETTNFHENIRLQMYPKIFENQPASSVNWENYKPVVFEATSSFSISKSILSLLLFSLLLIGLGIYRNLKYFR